MGKQLPPISYPFTLTDSFVIPNRGTVLVGPRESEVRGLIAKGDELELFLPDGQTIRAKVVGVEHFHTSPPQTDPPAGILLTTNIDKVPAGTRFRRVPSTVADVEGPWVDPNFESGLINRCRGGWNTPVTELTNGLLATYLGQKIALSLLLPEARKRVAANYTDDTEMFDEQLAEAVEFAERKT